MEKMAAIQVALEEERKLEREAKAAAMEIRQ